MAFVFNTLQEEQVVQARGNWFTFKPKQIKQMDDNLAAFLGREKRYPGLICLPEAFEDPEYKASPEGKAALEAAESEGIRDFVEVLKWRVHNNQVSLRLDLEKSNHKVDPILLAAPGEKDAIEKLAKYQKQKEDREHAEAARLKELLKTAGIK